MVMYISLSVYQHGNRLVFMLCWIFTVEIYLLFMLLKNKGIDSEGSEFRENS
jgi:hypothetical protein